MMPVPNAKLTSNTSTSVGYQISDTTRAQGIVVMDCSEPQDLKFRLRRRNFIILVEIKMNKRKQ